MPESMPPELNMISSLKPEEAQLIYEQYSTWARHLHTLVWVSTSFGIGVCLSGLTLYRKLTTIPFLIAGLVCLGILYLSHRLAEGNKAQCMNHWKLLNAIEAHWGLRDLATNPKGPPLGFAPGQTKGRTRDARVDLMWGCALAWVAAIMLKLLI